MIIINVVSTHARFGVKIAGGTVLSPLPESIPIVTFLLLTMTRGALPICVQQGIVNIAHDILPQCIEAVPIVAARPRYCLIPLEGGIMLSQVCLTAISFHSAWQGSTRLTMQ
jgi:hypothetical protein